MCKFKNLNNANFGGQQQFLRAVHTLVVISEAGSCS
jgi:hypothetical protein